jgi:hypothetical protein
VTVQFPYGFLRGGGGLAPHGGPGAPYLRSVLAATAGYTLAEAKAHPHGDLLDGQAFVVDGALWRYAADSELDGDDQLVAEFDSSAARGRLLREPGFVELALPISYATADAEVLYEVPDGAYLMPLEFYWSVTTAFTGGTASAIGVSSSKTGMTTKGDLLGGAAGDVAATLVAGSHVLGTIGPKWDSVAERRRVFEPGDTLLFDRVASVFEAGVGSVRVPCLLLANAGA